MAFTYDEEKQLEDLEPVLNSMGFAVVDLKMKSIHGTQQVHLVIYKNTGVSIEDCSDIYKTIFPSPGKFCYLCWFYKPSLRRYLLLFIPTGSQCFYDPGTGFPGVDHFVHRVIGRKGFAHGHDAEMFL